MRALGYVNVTRQLLEEPWLYGNVCNSSSEYNCAQQLNTQPHVFLSVHQTNRENAAVQWSVQGQSSIDWDSRPCHRRCAVEWPHKLNDSGCTLCGTRNIWSQTGLNIQRLSWVLLHVFEHVTVLYLWYTQSHYISKSHYLGKTSNCTVASHSCLIIRVRSIVTHALRIIVKRTCSNEALRTYM